MEPRYTVTEVLQDKWWIGAVALGVSLVVTPIVRFVAYRLGVVDRPDDLLKPHGRPVAYLGGVGICLGFLAGLGAYLAMIPDVSARWAGLWEALSSGDISRLLRNPIWNILSIAAAAVLITLVGLTDDIRQMRPRHKVYGQIAAAGLLLIGGVGERMAGMILLPIADWAGVEASMWLVVPASALMCMVVMIGACNATNLLDGLDGLCGGVTGIIALGFLALSMWLAMWGHRPQSDALRVAFCLAMAGGVIGFLPYNIPPASIFMGDAGSMLSGFFAAAMMAMFCQEGNARWFVAACAVFALPILDTALAVVRRLAGRVGIFTGDRSHLYDQLVDQGMTVRQVVVLFYILATVAAGIGVTLAIYVRGRHAVVIYAVLLTVIWSFFYKFGLITPSPRAPHSGADGGAERDE